MDCYQGQDIIHQPQSQESSARSDPAPMSLTLSVFRKCLDCLLPTDTKSGICFSQQPEKDSSRARKTKIGVTECQGNQENHIGDTVASKELPKFQQERGNKHTRERQVKPKTMGL